MGCLSLLFGLTLIIRTIFHLVVAGFAAKDLYDFQQGTKDFISQMIIKYVPGVDGAALELKLPLIFFIACGVLLLLVSATYPHSSSQRGALPYYAVLHILFVAMVVYVVFIRQIQDLSRLRDREFVYGIMSSPWFFPASLVLDVVSMVVAFLPVSKTRYRHSYAGAPMYRA